MYTFAQSQNFPRAVAFVQRGPVSTPIVLKMDAEKKASCMSPKDVLCLTIQACVCSVIDYR